VNRVADLTQSYITVEKATAFAGWAAALMLSKGNQEQALAIFESRNAGSKYVETVRKAVVEPGTTGGWGSPIASPRALGDGFMEFVRPRTVLGRLIGTQAVPFNVVMGSQTSGFGVGWAGQGKPILVSAGAFEREEMKRSKIAGIVVLTQELISSIDPAARQAITRDLAGATVEFSDRELLDPAKAGSDDEPASITNGAIEVTATGNTAAEVEADITAMVTEMATGGASMTAPYFVMKPTTALFLAGLRTAGGQRVFPDVGPLGGSILTIPVLTSASSPAQITLIDASHIQVADAGVDIITSTEATLQMDSAPAEGEAALVSLWQLNLIALKVTRFIRWKRAHAAAVVFMPVSY